uniref:DNA-(apurinic or apyrimidinic site) endonuclease n=1 Tax=Lingulaulax polyedra TaxID=160621 RepID=A0A516AG33_LINPO|nr:DNA-(apurinic or apyrimidinic site) lyase [Lingulodinium polyedra]
MWAGAGGPPRWARDPKRIITWNANGFMTRVTSQQDLAAFQALVREHDPDVVCLQEARVKAHCSNPKAKVSSQDLRDRSRPLDSEFQGPLKKALEAPPLDAYKVFWSLANGRAAGTALFVHGRLGAVEGTLASSLDAALAGCGGAGAGRKLDGHHPEGRLQYARFASLDLMNTYVPNNGWTAERHAERRGWDEAMDAFLRSRGEATQRPLLWCGDLNVAHTPADSTDEEAFRNEWDRDSKRFATREAYNEATPPENRGIPGFSDGERERFSRLFTAGGLFDAWRRLHRVGETPPEPGDAAFTWRGTPAVQSRFRARYEGMGQRLDYFLLSEALAPRLARCEILGRGAGREGFLGSDHCPVLLELREADAAAEGGS